MLLTGRGVLIEKAQNEPKTAEKINTLQGVSNTIFSLDQVKGILNLKTPYVGH